MITPDKVDNPNTYYAGVETLKGKKRKTANSFKRREALGKDGWEKGTKGPMDKFLVPKRKKVDTTDLTMMAASDSFS